MKDCKRKCVKCGSSPDDDPETKLYRFPKPGSTNSIRCERWAKYCFPDETWSSNEFQNKLYSQHKMLCHRHFKESAFIDYATKKLGRIAAPGAEEIIDLAYLQAQTLNTPPVVDSTEPLIEITIQPLPVVPGPSEVNAQKPVLILKQNDKRAFQECKLFLQKIAILRKTLGQLKNKQLLNKLIIMSKNVSPSLVLLLESEMKKDNNKATLRKWTTQEKIIAMKLYNRSADYYRLLRRIFPIPLPSSLKSLQKACVYEDGINMHVFKIISKYVQQLKPVNNEFVLMFNQMALSKQQDFIEDCYDDGEQETMLQPESYVMVFMIGGTTKKIKQLVAYYISDCSVTADRLADLIKEVLGQCYDHGINISATVCDMESVNCKALNILGATIGSPYFTYNNHEIVAIIDPSHLIKCFRNQFLEYDIEWPIDIANERAGTGIAKWSHIVQFYELDNANSNNAFAPLLKFEHLNPNNMQKNKVNLAIQLLSHSVSTGMYARIGKGLPASAIVTVDLLFKMDKIIDTLNSDTIDLRRGKPFSTNLKDITPHFALMNDMKKRFMSMKFIGAQQLLPLKLGWIWTLNGIERLWQTLRQRHPSLKSISTRRLQLDPLENLFGCIRANYGSNYDPTTTEQFVNALKTTLLTNISYTSTSNCENDNYEIIINNYKLYFYGDDGKPLRLGKTSFLERDLDDNIDIETSENQESKNVRCENLRTYKRVKRT